MVSNYNPRAWLYRMEFSGFLQFLQEKAGIHTNRSRSILPNSLLEVILPPNAYKSNNQEGHETVGQVRVAAYLLPTQQSVYLFVPFVGPNQTQRYPIRLITESPTRSIIGLTTMIILTSSKSHVYLHNPDIIWWDRLHSEKGLMYLHNVLVYTSSCFEWYIVSRMCRNKGLQMTRTEELADSLTQRRINFPVNPVLKCYHVPSV
jgi:hypothetical protein